MWCDVGRTEMVGMVEGELALISRGLDGGKADGDEDRKRGQAGKRTPQHGHARSLHGQRLFVNKNFQYIQLV